MWKRYWNGLTRSEKKKVTIFLVFVFWVIVPYVLWALGTGLGIFDKQSMISNVLTIGGLSGVAVLIFAGFFYIIGWEFLVVFSWLARWYREIRDELKKP